MFRNIRATIGIAAIVVVSLSAIITWYWRSEGPGVNLNNFQKIQGGMSKAEVEAILGGPAHNTLLPEYTAPFVKGNCQDWRGGGGEIVVVVGFDAHGIVVDKKWENLRAQQSFVEKLRSMLSFW